MIFPASLATTRMVWSMVRPSAALGDTAKDQQKLAARTVLHGRPAPGNLGKAAVNLFAYVG